MAFIKNIFILIFGSLLIYSCNSNELEQINVTSNISGQLDFIATDSIPVNTLLYQKFITTNANTDDLIKTFRLPDDKIEDIIPKQVVLNIASNGSGDLNSFRQIRVFLTTSPDVTDPDSILNNWVQIARLDTIKTSSQKTLALIPDVISVRNLILESEPEELFITSILETRKVIKKDDVFNTSIITNYQVSGQLD
ncbi:hypothetical protein [Flexithrix dorotheae]|uniref:hypothetical protein n=1 Tax=Flexithrix dorotheae TaxID=70993 RepID=UPI00037D5717|nr:hypothetical protein [Flexithrix dorotheae]